MLSNYRCTKAPAPEKYQPCSIPVCDPGKCQNRCFQCVYEKKNKPTNHTGLPARPPCARRQPGVRSDGGGPEPFKRGVRVGAALHCVWNGPNGRREGTQGPEPGGRTPPAACLGGREGGRHGWIWVPGRRTEEERRSAGKQGKAQAKKEAACTSQPPGASCCAEGFRVDDLVASRHPLWEMGVPVLQMKRSPERDTCTDVQPAAVGAPPGSARPFGHHPPQRTGQAFTFCQEGAPFGRSRLCPAVLQFLQARGKLFLEKRYPQAGGGGTAP